jgi:hypothetical protein
MTYTPYFPQSSSKKYSPEEYYVSATQYEFSTFEKGIICPTGKYDSLLSHRFPDAYLIA